MKIILDLGFSLFYINSKNNKDFTCASYLRMLHHQYLLNQTKLGWAFRLTDYNQEEGKSWSLNQILFVCLLCKETLSLQPLQKCRQNWNVSKTEMTCSDTWNLNFGRKKKMKKIENFLHFGTWCDKLCSFFLWKPNHILRLVKLPLYIWIMDIQI